MAFVSTYFPEELVKEVFVQAQGHSALAKLAAQTPVSFSGNDIMTFTFDGEVNLVGEGEAKASHTNSNNVVKMAPLKVEYGARVSDEFIRCSDEKQLSYLDGFREGFSKKIARGLDIMALHGVNPKTGAAASTLIGTKSFDTNSNVNSVTYDATDLEGNIDSAVAAIGDYEMNGIAMSKAFAAGLAGVVVNGVKQFPELGWGANPDAVRGVPSDVNSTVSFVDGKYAYLGDFRNAFKWGYADQIPLEVIEFGDPDGNGDLKRYNQVYLRAEAWIGWAILDPDAFARIETEAQGATGATGA